MRHNIFAIEVCLRMDANDELRKRLRDLVLDHPAQSSPGKKWGLLKQAASLLLEGEARFEKGCWDYFDDDQKARTDYDMWSNGMITEEGARPEPSGAVAESSEPRFMTFTISLLLQADTHSSHQLARLCEIPQPDLWKRKTFLRILSGLACVSYAAVKSDVLYLIPRDDRWGLTAKDLEHPKFHYLRRIE